VAHIALPVAGAARLRRSKFHLYNTIGSLIWILVMLLAGVFSMHTFDWMDMFARSSKWSFVFLLVCSIPIAVYSWWQRRKSKLKREAEEHLRIVEPELSSVGDE